MKYFIVSPEYSPVLPLSAKNVTPTKIAPTKFRIRKKTQNIEIKTPFHYVPLTFESKKLDSLVPCQKLKSDELLQRLQDAQQKLPYFNINVDSFSEVISTCLYLEEKEDMLPLEKIGIQNIHIRIQKDSKISFATTVSDSALN